MIEIASLIIAVGILITVDYLFLKLKLQQIDDKLNWIYKLIQEHRDE